MKIAVRCLTPTQLEARQRSLSFRASIARKAAELAAAKTKIMETTAPNSKPVVDPPKIARVPECPEPVDVAFPSIAQIQDLVARYYKVTVLDLKSPRRLDSIVLPRHIAIYLCRRLTPFSLPNIGKHFGGRDHSSIHHGIKRIERLALWDSIIAGDIAHLVGILEGA